MLCRHCGKKISLLRRLTDAEFCSDRHRTEFLELEREAAVVRLTESGARIMPLDRAPVRKGGNRQVRAKDEIPAPLAGILREPERKPKARRVVLGQSRMMGWTLIQELPQLSLAVQARRMDIAGGVPMEAHPARPAQIVQNAPALPAPPACDQAETDAPPLAALAGLSLAAPLRGITAWRVAVAAWAGFGPGLMSMPHLAAPLPAPGACWPLLPLAVPLAAPMPLQSAAMMPGVDAEPRLDARGQAVESRLAMPSGGGRRLDPDPGAEAAGPPLGGADALAGIDLAGLLQISGRACQMPRSVPSGRVRAMGPRRRLVGPRVRPAAKPPAGLTVSRQAGLPPGRPVNAGPLQMRLFCGGTLRGGTAGPAAPARFLMPRPNEEALGLRLADLSNLGPLLPAAHWTAAAACPAPEAAWPRQDALRPRLGLTVEGELAIGLAPFPAAVVEQAEPEAECAVPAAVIAAPIGRIEAVAKRPAVEAMAESPSVAAEADGLPTGPPLIDRQFPLFASRGLKSRQQPWLEPASQTALWAVQLARQPLIRPLRLIPDHADGSGSRVTEIKPAEPSKPWLSIRLPSLPVASWRAAPADLKWITLALPAILLLALYSFLPARSKNSVETASSGSSQSTALSQRFETIRTAIMQRAAVKMADDFRAGLGAWQGTSGWAQTWTYTDASYVSPGNLALYKPSLVMKDYVFAFLGQIDRRSLNWVVRARDENNYLAMRIVMTRSGPMPSAALIRYAVLDGKMDRQTTLPLPVAFRDGTMQQVEVTVAGDTITTRIMGQVVDSFSEDRLAGGGVGFYSPKGDRSLLRWISITHQYDYIGRLCALLAPYHVSPEARRME